MTDKSFGDHTDRTIVKNPLLSTAVVGLSLEDLTHNAVILPVAQQTPGLIASQDTKQVKCHPHDHHIQPSGDANTVTLPNRPSNPKPHDDFDVNEYFARLQGTRYISAPPHASLDTNANIPEENLEEISLDEEKVVQGTLSSEIAQNLSQLPQVLPHVANAVFNSFSSMLSMRSREQTPGVKDGGCGEVEVMRHGEVKSDERKALKEPPVGNTSNSYRITTKKKAYAQIPGLSTDYNTQNISYTNANQPPQSFTQPSSYFVPSYPQADIPKLSPIGVPTLSSQNTKNSKVIESDTTKTIEGVRNLGDSTESRVMTDEGTSVALFPSKEEGVINSVTENAQISGPDLTLVGHNLLGNINKDPHGSLHSKSDSFLGQNLIKPLNPSLEFQGDQGFASPGTIAVASKTTMSESVLILNPSASSPLGTSTTVSHISSTASEFPVMSSSSSILTTSQQMPSIIPPPTMFSNESRRDNNLKTLLPPSIARRLSGNQPIIKQQNAPLAPPVDFFIPSPIDGPCPAQNLDGATANFVSQTTTRYPASVLTEPHTAVASFPPALISLGGYSATTPLQASTLEAISEASMRPPMFFNPASIPSPVESPQTDPPGFPPVSSSQTTLGPPKQLFDPALITTNIPEPVKTTPDPPKLAPGNVNFRLTKKRPQYYSGPIDGVGSISNNVKPIISPIEPTNAFQGALYTPQSIPKQDPSNINQMPSIQPQQETSTPFNLNQAFEDNGTANRQYNYIQGRHETQPQQEYNTVFDLSRQTDEEYKQSKDDEGSGSGFGIIGSLKSKLSSLDINKIQNSVTTFFDPAYNTVATETTNHQGNQTYSQPENATANNAPNYDNLQIFIPHQNNSQQYYGSNYTDLTQNQPDIAYDTAKYNQQNYYQNPEPNVHNYGYYHNESYNAPEPSHSQAQNAEPFSNNLLSIYENPPVAPPNLPMANVFGSQQNNENELSYNANIDGQPDNDSSISKENEIISNVENTLNIDNSLGISNVSVFFGEHTKETEVDTYQYFGKPDAPEQTDIDSEISYLQDNINNISLHESLATNSSDSNLLSSDESKYNKQELYKMEDVTSQMIENITSPIQLTNPVEVPFNESDAPQEIRGDFETEQCEEITNITQETIESIQIKTAIEFLEKRDSELFENNYIEHTDIKNPGWCDRKVQEPNVSVTTDHDYTFHNDPNAIGFFSGNSLFFDNIPNNTSDEIKSEFKTTVDKSPTVVHARQMSFPTAPPVEDLDDNKSDGTGDLDVHLIEQDAKADFPGFEEFVIEPSETDDDKIEVKEQNKTISEDKIEESFTHRIDKFKHCEDAIAPVVEPTQLFDIPTSKSPSISIASYFDTGNYAAETHYRNSLTSPTSLNMYNVAQPVTSLFATGNPTAEGILDAAKQEAKIPQAIDLPHLVPPGFSVDIPKPYIPDTCTQTSVTSTVTQSNVKQITEEIAIGAVLPDVNIYELLPNERNQPLIPPGFTTALHKPIVSEYERTPAHVSPFFRGESSGMTPASAISDTSNTSTLSDKQNTEKTSNKYIDSSKSSDVNPLNLTSTSNLPSTGSVQDASVTQKSIFFDKSTPEYQCSALTIDKLLHQNASSIQNILAASNVQTDVSNTTPISKPDSTKSPVTIQRISLETADSATETPVLQMPAPNAQSLPDPLNFFATTVTAEDTRKPESNASFNRLASYFATPTNTDTKKSFFELSQGQDHLRKVNQQHTDQYAANLQLMKDLTTTDFYQPSEEQVVKTVNYFMVEYNHMRRGNNSFASILSSSKSRLNNAVGVDNDASKSNVPQKDSSFKKKRAVDVLDICKYCCDKTLNFIDKVDINKQDIKVRTAMDNKGDESGSVKGAPSKDGDQGKPSNVSFNLNMEENNEETVMAMSENRLQTEYVPVKHHWFYRVDLEGKSTWKGFSVADSNSLEAAFHSADLTDDTVVATDGGRYDVNVKGRLRVAVYWTDKPTNVRRCSWFYKGTTDARYVPYTEAVAEKLEEEYRHGVTTGEWHRRLPLPNNETVVMHGATVMVHFLQGAPADSWSAPSSYMFSKKTVYRSLPKIAVAEDQTQRIDHLVMFVHGAGESRRHAEKLQSTTRPRVVRRGCDESEIEDQEPSRIDHLLLLCHGVGSACDMRFRSVEEVVDDFRATSMQLIQGHYKNSYDSGIVGRIEVLPVSWHASLHGGERGVDRRLSRISLPSIPLLRGFTNDTVLDVLFYTSPAFCQSIIETVCQELNRIYSLFVSRNPDFRGGVSLGGHSLGSVILYDLLCHQGGKAHKKEYINDAASTGMPNIVYPKLEFTPACLYALGSPIAMFECIRGVETLGEEFKLPTCSNFFNIFHPYDPIAYRIEPLINAQLKGVSPFLIPHHKGRKRMHLELKETVARVGADIKQRVVDSIKATWSSMWRTQPPTTEQLEKVVEEEMEREALNDNNKDENETDVDLDVSSMVGKLNAGRRVDYVLQEAPFEMINEYLFSMSSHVCYWESEDTMLLILREIYESQGVQPDSTLPQQTMSVQRTRIATDKDESSYSIGTDQASGSK